MENSPKNLEHESAVAAPLDWSQCPAVESVPGRVSGAWVFKNTRMPVSLVFENFAVGATIDEIMEWHFLTREQIVQFLQFASPKQFHAKFRTL